MDIPWSRMSLNRNHPSMELDYPEFDETAGVKLGITFNPAYADLLLEGTGHTFAELAALAKDRRALPRFPLLVSVKATTNTITHEVQSTNIVARIQGKDPKLKAEYVVLSAHIDHLGIGEPINGDRIYNGAMDNGSGSALLLDVARSLKHSRARLRRSVLFVWVTGEEKGLLGSKFFAAHPTVRATSIIADINSDMFLPIIPLKVLTVYGLAESDLGDRVKQVADPLGLRVQPDPAPLRNVFIRSDQYNFVRKGIPSVMIDVGYTPGSPEEKIMKDWRTERYHAPSDDANQPVNLATAAGYEEVIRALTVAVADDPRRPAWKQDSFFRRYAAPVGN
jgi:Zn-dependent M28 family amino/carboxypeptidase